MKASDELKDDLRKELNEKQMLTDYVCLRDGTIVYVDVTLELTLDRFYRKFENEIKQEVQQRVDAFFDVNNWDYGKTLKNTDMVKEVSDMKQINNFHVVFKSSDQQGPTITTKLNEILRPDQISISLIYD